MKQVLLTLPMLLLFTSTGFSENLRAVAAAPDAKSARARHVVQCGDVLDREGATN